MKQAKAIFLLTITCLLFAACEDVIVLNLDTVDEKYVIEANLSDQFGGASVAISKTMGFADSSGFKGASGALVSIKDEDGTITLLSESGPGIYVNPALKGTSGKTYQLKVEINGKTFTSASKMPELVKLDSVYLLELKVFDGTRKLTHVQFKDPIGKGNNYRFLEYKNGIYSKSIRVSNDEFFDGNVVNQVLSPKEFNEETKLKPGDKIKVEFLTITDEAYKYWFSVDSGAQGSGDSAAPINPVSNIKGGAIGYFSAHTMQQKEYVVN